MDSTKTYSEDVYGANMINIFDDDVSFSADASDAPLPTQNLGVSHSATADANFVSTNNVELNNSVTIIGQADFAGALIKQFYDIATMTGEGNFVTTNSMNYATTAVMTGEGSFTPDEDLIYQNSVNMVGQGSFVGSLVVIYAESVTFTGIGYFLGTDSEEMFFRGTARFQISHFVVYNESVTFVGEAGFAATIPDVIAGFTFADFVGLVWVDEVNDTSETTGTGDLTLVSFGYEPDARPLAVVGDGNSFVYKITSELNWEIGIGTYTASSNTLSRDTIIASSNSGLAVSWTAGRKSVTTASPIEVMGYVIDTVNGLIP